MSRLRDLVLAFFSWLRDSLDEQAWARLPHKIIFLRHGQAEHNLEGGAILQEENPDTTPPHPHADASWLQPGMDKGRQVQEENPQKAAPRHKPPARAP